MSDDETTTKDGVTRMTLRLPAELASATKTVAGVRGVSVHQYVVDAVRAQVTQDIGTEEARAALLSALEEAASHVT